MFIFIAILNSVFILAGSLVSKRLLNAVSLLIAPQIALDFVGGHIYQSEVGSESSDESLNLVLALVSLANLAFTFRYCVNIGAPISIIFKKIEERANCNRVRIRYILTVFFITVSALVYLLAKNSGGNLFTRELYEITREGFGHLFFTCLFLCYSGISIALCNTYGSEKLFWVLLFFISSACLGAKTPIVMTVYIILIYYSVKPIKNSKGLLVWISLSVLCGAIAIVSFYVYSEWARDNIILSMVSYSDGIRNFARLIDKWTNFKMGLFWFEDNIISCLPRSVFPSKPLVYGSGNLAPFVFISQIIDKGTPSFTRYGRIWADFGYFSFLIVPIMCGISGEYAARFEDSLMRRRTFAGLSGFFLSIFTPFFNIGSVFLSTVFINILFTIFIYSTISSKLSLQKLKR